MSQGEGPSPSKTVLLLLFFLATGAAAVLILRQRGLPRTPAARAPQTEAPADEEPALFAQRAPETPRPAWNPPPGSSLEYVTPGASPAVGPAAQPGTALPPAPAPRLAPSGPQAARDGSVPADLEPRLKAAGVPTDTAGLASVGRLEGALVNVFGTLLKHPKLLRAVFDNRLVVDTYFGRGDIKAACSDYGALKKELGGLLNKPAVQASLNNGPALIELSQTRFFNHLRGECGTVKEMLEKPAVMQDVAMGTPGFLAAFMNPNVQKALAGAGAGAAPVR